MTRTEMNGWQFWIDRGGTFTDVVARRPDGSVVTHKLLSENPRRYRDAAIAAIRELLDVAPGERVPVELIDDVKMGTTVATNALLERQGEPTVLVTTRGFADALRIGYQTRPDLFALDIVLPEMLYQRVIEVDERLDAHGRVQVPLDEDAARAELQLAKDAGFDALAIALLHGYRMGDHERRLAEIGAELGFGQISVSHEVNPLMKLVSRGDTTVVDAYLSPILRRYVAQVESELRGSESADGDAGTNSSRLMFMQSNGGLTEAHRFRGKDALLSGPAGGVVGMVRTGEAAGFGRLVGFDMGGTSTDVSHYAGTYERTQETEVAGVRVRAPMMLIHTVAAGGGSILHFDQDRLRVGPDSAGADPGPACYGNGGPLTITDCNVMVGKLNADHFPSVFGADGNQPLDVVTTRTMFNELAEQVTAETGRTTTAVELAEGFLEVAVENMANAIKKLSVQRGYDISGYTLACFGGAGGQHACLVADRLGIERVLLHPQAGVLSALGIGLADTRVVLDRAVEAELVTTLVPSILSGLDELAADGRADLLGQGVASERIEVVDRVRLRYQGSDTALEVDVDRVAVAAEQINQIVGRFEDVHRARFGFVSPERALLVESLQSEVIGVADVDLAGLGPVHAASASADGGAADGAEIGVARVGVGDTVMAGLAQSTSFFERSLMPVGVGIDGPAVIVEATSTTVIEPGWQASISPIGDLLLERVVPRPDSVSIGTTVDPVKLEIFNNLFMNIAEQMGVVLENTSASVNIKERLDFSCALFDPNGDLVANAPHIPVHLGSMSESIKTIIRENAGSMKPGDVFAINAPYNGGTHLPDVTVIKPVFDDAGTSILFYVASRGHHADIGGKTPGSAPADSVTVDEEGVLIDNVQLVAGGRFLESEFRELLASGRYPARNPDMNVADIKAQIAACEKGAIELAGVIDHYGLDVVHAYMGHVMDNAAESVRRVIDRLSDGSFAYDSDDGYQVRVSISVDRAARRATIDFTGTAGTHPGNHNAPSSIAHSAVLYVFRSLVDSDIPLNAGCMVPLDIIIPEPSMISPRAPSAVIAGNVETSQLIVDTLFGALGVVAASQGTMNNFIWGNADHQYYETICGGAGATATADGASAVHTNMTNTRLTDPEVLEWRHPVVLEDFRIRGGSGGDGAHRGGDGIVRRLRFEEPMIVNILSSHRVVPPYGVAGGEAGSVGRNRVERSDGTTDELEGYAQTAVEPGDVVVIETPGGGGFGTARE